MPSVSLYSLTSMFRTVLLSITLSSAALLLEGTAFAQVPDATPFASPAAKVRAIPPTLAPPTPTPLPQKGVLSRSATENYNTKLVDAPWGGGGDSAGTPPIAGSVSRKSEREWVAKLFNNSDDAYSVSVEVIQMDKAGKRERLDSFSTRLSAKGAYERSLTATERTADAQLNLVRWKNLSAKPASKEEPENQVISGN